MSSDEVTDSPNDAVVLRELLWLRHGCPSAALYGDDGEMQCSACGIDFARMSANEIQNCFLEGQLNESQLNESQLELDIKDARQILRLDPPEKK